MEEGGDGVVRARVEDASLAGSTSHGLRAAGTGMRRPKNARPNRRAGAGVQHLTVSLRPFDTHMQKDSHSHILIHKLVQTLQCSKTDSQTHLHTGAFQRV